MKTDSISDNQQISQAFHTPSENSLAQLQTPLQPQTPIQYSDTHQPIPLSLSPTHPLSQSITSQTMIQQIDKLTTQNTSRKQDLTQKSEQIQNLVTQMKTNHQNKISLQNRLQRRKTQLQFLQQQVLLAQQAQIQKRNSTKQANQPVYSKLDTQESKKCQCSLFQLIMVRTLTAPLIDQEEMQLLYEWVDQIPLSRPKRNITRDFSDGVLTAEVVKFFIPNILDLHNYQMANSVKSKTYNWESLNQKVFCRMGFKISQQDISDIVNCVPDSIEKVLKVIKFQIENFRSAKRPRASSRKRLIKPEQIKVEYQNVPDPYEDAVVREPDQVYDDIIEELRETVEILEMREERLGKMLEFKDKKIARLEQRVEDAGII